MKQYDIDEIVKKNICNGCGLCASVFDSVEMKYDGNIRLPVSEKKMSEKEKLLFNRICPAINISTKKLVDSDELSLPIIGPMIAYYNGYSNDEQIRYRASSGGALTSFLAYLLDENIVQAVLQIKKSSNPFDNIPVISKSSHEIIECAGSRYAPTSLLIRLKEALESNECLAIVGKPCDIRGAKLYISSVPEYEKKKIVYINFLCGGMPKMIGTKKILEKLNCTKYEDLLDITYRGNGWPGRFVAKTKEKKYEMSYEDAWGDYLGRNVLLSCKLCIDSVGDSSDITFGDGWKVNDKGYPVFEDDNGIDLIIVRNKWILELLLDANRKGYLTIDKKDENEFLQIQPSQCVRRKTSNNKILAMKIMRIPFVVKDQKYINKYSYDNGKIKKIKNILGTIKRIIKYEK